MCLDHTYLSILRRAGTGVERRRAEKVLNLLHGRHAVLVALLFCMVLAQEVFPVLLGRCMSSYLAVGIGTVCMAIIGEILPAALFARFALPLGSVFTGFVHFIKWISKFLKNEYILPQHHLYRVHSIAYKLANCKVS